MKKGKQDGKSSVQKCMVFSPDSAFPWESNILYWAQNRMNYDCSGKHAEKSHDRGNSKQLLETHDMAKITHEHGKTTVWLGRVLCMARQICSVDSALQTA